MKTLENKLDQIIDDVTELRITSKAQQVTLENQEVNLNNNTQSLQQHMARTDAVEDLVALNKEILLELIKASANLQQKALDEAVKPLVAHADFVKGAAWALGGLLTIALSVAAIYFRSIK
jgi:hypothetical protein